MHHPRTQSVKDSLSLGNDFASTLPFITPEKYAKEAGKERNDASTQSIKEIEQPNWEMESQQFCHLFNGMVLREAAMDDFGVLERPCKLLLSN
ncbi:hypothetical protein Y1Q_0007127 [Alligator mississippiensis]|uniref:Uncharacterized protein n=1 Tax=Alligator mississippiensis TaxID=8496 RepID=A0A151N5Q2_ALLMI|nr:hypothetical protein Y1Q_0007127 [Alligator mississippiensis]